MASIHDVATYGRPQLFHVAGQSTDFELPAYAQAGVSTLTYNVVQAKPVGLSLQARLAVFTGLLILLNIMAVTFVSITISSFLVGNSLIGLGALGPAIAAVFGVGGIFWRILSRPLRK